MIHTWHETPNPLKKEAVVITAECDFRNCSWTSWTMWLERILCHIPLRYCCLCWATLPGSWVHWWASMALPSLPATTTTVPALGPEVPCQLRPGLPGPCLSYAVRVFVSSSVPDRPLSGHEPHWSLVHGLISQSGLRSALSPWTCSTVAVPCLSILSRSRKTDLEEQAYVTLCL